MHKIEMKLDRMIAVAPPLPRPRNRASIEFQEWKQMLLSEPHLSFKVARQGDERFRAAAILGHKETA